MTTCYPIFFLLSYTFVSIASFAQIQHDIDPSQRRPLWLLNICHNFEPRQRLLSDRNLNVHHRAPYIFWTFLHHLTKVNAQTFSIRTS